MERRYLAIVGLLIVVMTVGCTGILDTDEPGLTIEDDEQREQFEAVVESLDDSEAAAFKIAITDEDGLTDDGAELLVRLHSIEAIDPEARDAVAASVASEATVDTTTMERIDRILASPDPFRVTVFTEGIEDTSGDGLLDGEVVALGLEPAEPSPNVARIAEPLADDGYSPTAVAYLQRVAAISSSNFQWQQAEAIGLLDEAVDNGTVEASTIDALEDSSGDGLLDGMAVELGVHPGEESPAVAAVAEPLATGGYASLDVTYLERVATIADYQGNEYEVWAQAESLGLLDDAVANGSVGSDDLWALENDADNRLLNGMEREFGSDPTLADTSGDGFADHLKWGPVADLGLPAHPTQPDIYVEVDTVTGIDHPSPAQYERIQTTFVEEPPDHIGPIYVHFIDCNPAVEPVTTTGEIQDRTTEYRDIRGLGFHYLLINDGPVYWFGDEVSGIAWPGPYGEPFMMARGDLNPGAETSLIAHELGHKLGIFANDFEGVDSTTYSFEEYNSVMNYNRTEEITFSTAPPFNDYEHMVDREFGSSYESIDRLEAMWEAGSIDEDVLC